MAENYLNLAAVRTRSPLPDAGRFPGSDVETWLVPNTMFCCVLNDYNCY